MDLRSLPAPSGLPFALSECGKLWSLKSMATLLLLRESESSIIPRWLTTHGMRALFCELRVDAEYAEQDGMRDRDE